MEPDLPRKLSAVLYADVAGYSRLTGQDEDGTHRRLSEYLDLFDAAVSLHNGRTVHYAGDAILAEFPTASEALKCAVSTQDELAGRNAVLPGERRLMFRIGLNIGEVIVDRGDIYGEGVNVAARLETLADPGGICISESFRAAVGGRFEFGFEFLGEQRVKNIAEPLRAYRVVDGRERGARQDARRGEAGDRPSIAVLALDNMSGDAEQEYFSDGISEDIITDLSKLSGLFVIARNSSFAYKGRQVNVREIAAALGVRYVLEGSVRRGGNRVRVTVQLIDGTSGGHVWAERYDRDLTDIFAVQDEIRREVVSALGARLGPGEASVEVRSPTASMSAYDYFLRGREETLADTESTNLRARELLERAYELDPRFSLACSYLSRNYILSYINRWGGDAAGDIDRALEFATRSVELDSSNPHAHFADALAKLWSRQHDAALAAIDRAIAIDGNFADGYAGHGVILVYSGAPDEAIERVGVAMRLDPHYRDILLHIMALACFHDRRYAEAIEWLRRRLIRRPDSDISRVLLASACGQVGDFEQARARWSELKSVNPDYSIEHRRSVLPYRDPAQFDEIIEGLARAGLVEASSQTTSGEEFAS